MSDMLSQEEIDALLRGTSDTPAQESDIDFSDEEKDTIGEVGNISMGTASTTLSTLLGQKVTITTPMVQVVKLSDLSNEYALPFVAVDVKYKEGLEGTNLLILKENDVRIITDLMMGGDGKVQTDPITDLHLSAIGEAMNQMVGSSATSLSEMFNKKIDISPPDAFILDLSVDNLLDHFSDYSDIFVRIAFRMVIGDLIDSEIMQLLPIDFAKEIIKNLLENMSGKPDIIASQPVLQKTNVEQQAPPTNSYNTEMADNTYYQERQSSSYNKQNNLNAEKMVNIQPVQFQSFDEPSVKSVPENIALIQDVPLKITVELGRTVKKISEILEFGPGTIVELDKLVGEPLDILVNGQYVAKGEVVVIDENYGIRVTDIVNPVKRFSKVYE